MGPTVRFAVPKHFPGAATAATICLLGTAAALLVPATAGAAPAPKMKAAFPLDRNGDGRVDAVRIRWTQKVRGGGAAKKPFAHKVGGYRVTRVAPARGTRQLVHVAQKPDCDIGGSVRVSYRPPRAVKKRVRAARGKRTARRHKVDMRRSNSKFPRITCAVTRDTNGNGRLDGIRLTYSRPVKSRAQSGGRFRFSVAGYQVTAVSAAKGRFLDLSVAEGAAPDTGVTPAITYSRATNKRERRFAVRAGKRAEAFAATFQGTRDGVPPRLLAARTGDSDRNGLIDMMTVRFSEPVTAASPAAVAVLGMRVRAAAPAGPGVLNLVLEENTARGDARPGVWITADGAVRDGAGNPAVAGAVTPADGAPPVVVGAVTRDDGGSPGQIDAVGVTFSEPVTLEGPGAAAFAVSDRNVVGVDAPGTAAVRVRVAEGGTPDTGLRPMVGYMSGRGARLRDAGGNEAADAFLPAADGVAPVLLSATTGDKDGNGRIDTVSLRFSEDIRLATQPSTASFSVTGYTVASVGAANGPSVTLGLAERSSPDTGARPAVAYRRAGGDVRDASGNAAADASVAQAVDGARPVLVSARTGDVNGNGKIDRIETTWSEPLVHGGATSGPFSLAAAGRSVSRVYAAQGATLRMDLVEAGSHDTGATPTVSYTGSGSAVRDAAGLEPDKRGWPGLTADGAPPRLVAATTADKNGNGSLDSVSTRFSEPVVHAREENPSSFTVAGFTVTSAEAGSGESIELKLAESGAPDTGATPGTAYVGTSVRDTAANLAAGGTIFAAADGARPVLMSAETVDADDDGRLDAIDTEWSEPLQHAGDGAAPFAIAAAGFAVAGTDPAAGNTLRVLLEEPAEPDTGSAPALTYQGGGVPVRDTKGLEAANRTYTGLTRDALPPRLVRATTADVDANGKLDAVEIEWSEQVTGSTTSSPFAVAGRTPAPNVQFDGRRTRIPFAEDPAYDTHETPAVSYDAGAGDLADIAKGPGDTADPAPAVVDETPLDKAPPIVVAAKTADLMTPPEDPDDPPTLQPNGTIDAVLVTFSEPIQHAVDGLAPFALGVAGRTVSEIEGDTGPSDRNLYVTIREASSPDGGYKPNVSVLSGGPLADRVKDRAAEPNDAKPMTFTGTADEVRPVLLSAQLGERDASGDCTKAAVPGIDGRVDCALAKWSEPVTHAEDTDAPWSISSSGWAIEAGGLGDLGPSDTLEIPLAAAAQPDRDRAGTTLAYDAATGTPVLDVASPPNPSLSGTVPADPACRDTGQEPNDVQGDAKPLNSRSPAFERKCAFDPDWFTMQTNSEGYLELLARPAPGVEIEVELVRSDGAVIGDAQPDGSGGARRLTATGLDPGTTYWAHVTADDVTAPQEGPYCIVFTNESDEDKKAGCGPLVGQLVFTEAGFGSDKFLEIKNDFDVPVDMNGAGAQLVLRGNGVPPETCTIQWPTGSSIIDPGEHAIIEQTATATTFGCDKIDALDPAGMELELSASGAIDVVDFRGIISGPLADQHSLQFVPDETVPSNLANDDVATRWCRTWTAHTKGEEGDGCAIYRINEVLWKPAATATASDGRAFVEIAGNLPAKLNSGLLGGWMLAGVSGLTGEGIDFALPADASPRANGTYVIADGLPGPDEATLVSSWDVIWEHLDLNSPTWPDGEGVEGSPRGVQLIGPEHGSASVCVDAFGWATTGQNFTKPLDELRGCRTVEGQQYADATVNVSAARGNLATPGATSYNEAFDTDQNQGDFCPQNPPSPGQLNTRPNCSG